MSNFDFEGYSEGDWDEQWDLAWNEFDWEKYLRDQEQAISLYLSHYEKAIGKPDRIDEVAHLMGWDQQNWTTDDSLGEDSLEESDAPQKNSTDDEPDYDLDPYTLHKHPIYIATKSLYTWLHGSWEQVAPVCAYKIPIQTALAFQGSLFRGEQQSLLAIQALDMGDYSLAVCQYKRALAEINASLKNLKEMNERQCPTLVYFKAQALIRLFDIREIWLRVMRDCREELDRRFSEGDN